MGNAASEDADRVRIFIIRMGFDSQGMLARRKRFS
jgi:hypothetical protein